MIKRVLKNISHLIPDKAYLRLRYYLKFHKKINLKDPKTFNEKLQWLKLYNRRPEYIRMVDKYEAKQYVADIIGEEYIIPTLGVWDRFDDIDFDKLPEKFVIKCTHDSGGLVICDDKSKFDISSAKKKVEKSLKTNYYWHSREWPYKNVPRRIIAEEFLNDGSGKGVKDYKILNFNGQPQIIQVDFDRFTEHKKNLYTTEWKLCDFSFNYPSHPEIDIPRPEKLDEMLQLAKKLSAGEPFMRTDFYYVDGRIYFGELTLFPASGYGWFDPETIDLELGKKMILPTKIKK